MAIRTFERVFAATAVALGIHASGFAREAALQDPSWSQQGSALCGIEWKIVSPVLLTKLAGGVARISWPTPTITYRNDLVRGSLTRLSATHGDFRAATEGCLADDFDGTVFGDADIPAVGEGYWYLVREDVYAGCPGWGQGTYSAAYQGQAGREVGDRDRDILASGRDCTCYAWCRP